MNMILNPGSNIVPNFLNFDYHLIRRLLIQLDKQDMKPVGLEENISYFYQAVHLVANLFSS